MTFRQFLSILVARKRLFIAILLGVLIPAVALSFLLPKRYTAVASVVVDVKPDPLSAIAYQSLMTPGVIATQIDILQSERVARRAVRTLRLTEVPQVRQQWQEAQNGEGDIETWLIDRLQRDLDVKPGRESSVINVSYVAPDPRFAAALANAFVQAYIETSVELRVDPAKQYSSFFDSRAKEAREALEKAQSKLSAFQNEHGLIMTDERLDVENQRLNEISSQLVMVQSLSAEASSRQAQANAGSGDKMFEITSNPVVASLRADMSRSEARLQEISARLGDKNPQVIELKASINELRQRIDAEVKRLTAGVGISGNISRQREAQLRADLEAQRAKVLKLKQVRDEGAVITREIENAQRNYDNIMQRQSVTSIESQATSSNASVLTSASAPIEASFPKIPLNIALGIFVGALLAVGVVMAAELRDRRVREIDDIQELLGLSIIGVLPGPKSKRSIGFAAGGAQRQRLLGSAPVSKAA
ncbi:MULTISPECIES: chain length determinant protein EpsF [unclassified Roseateles]|uniref:chain length determinant protein EpsF n=1 Tax=unclassified Roseateles TaxID=2626991 RepID=UPI0006F1C378|nr:MULTISPECIES: chain length determinant protein EpsF [unclassified Roseateles]KQW41985.1 chain-length determining protein [Pelomonas sp. Root405]KRA67588.1 chain-length determining protein [Pelomonas sp. Root662]